MKFILTSNYLLVVTYVQLLSKFFFGRGIKILNKTQESVIDWQFWRRED